MITIRVEEEKDYRDIEYLTREAFWDLYHPGCSEHLIVHKIRKTTAFVRELSLIATDENCIVGSIIYSRAKIVNDKGQVFEVLCMGPLSVLPSRQREGIGSLLMRHSVDKAKGLGFKAIILFGNPNFYHRFGFVNAENYGIQTATGENFPAFMVLELGDRALRGMSGKFYADPVFEVNKEELESFEQGFPYKEKHVAKTQLKDE